MYEMTPKPPSVANSVARIRSYVRKSGIKPGALARQAGLGRNTLRDIDQASWNPRLQTLRQLEALIPEDFS